MTLKLGYSSLDHPMENSIGPVHDFHKSASGVKANFKIVHAHGRRQWHTSM